MLDASQAETENSRSMVRRRMPWSIGLTLAFVLGEALAGVFTGSLALLSDAGHNLADGLALGLSWYAMWIADKPSDCHRTFGYHRVAILAALANAVSLVVIALIIFWQAWTRLLNPPPVESVGMIWVASIAIVINLIVAFWLHRGAHHDVNVRSAYIHMLGDAASALGVVVAGVVILLTGSRLADPIASFLIGALILWSSWGILRETVNTLLEGTPEGVDMGALERRISGVKGVLNVHDLHVWTVGPGVRACSCHVVVEEQGIRNGQSILRDVAEELEHHYGINHSTLQIEVERCDMSDVYCRVEPSHEPGHCHGHAH
jgi:cobalt-zinc-cadmium efflux system protein